MKASARGLKNQVLMHFTKNTNKDEKQCGINLMQKQSCPIACVKIALFSLVLSFLFSHIRFCFVVIFLLLFYITSLPALVIVTPVPHC